MYCPRGPIGFGKRNLPKPPSCHVAATWHPPKLPNFHVAATGHIPKLPTYRYGNSHNPYCELVNPAFRWADDISKGRFSLSISHFANRFCLESAKTLFSVHSEQTNYCKARTYFYAIIGFWLPLLVLLMLIYKITIVVARKHTAFTSQWSSRVIYDS